MSIFSALAPYPIGPGGGAIFSFFFILFVIGAIAGIQELLIAVRAAGLLVAVRRQESERIRSTRQLKELATKLGESHPALAPGMAQLGEVIYEQQGVVRLAAPPAELLSELSTHRGPLPRALLRAIPLLLVVLGICGTLAGLSVGLSESDQLNEVLVISLRATVWGLLSAATLVGISRWSAGTAQTARDRLVSWLESQAGAGSSASGLIRLSRSQDQLRTMMEQTTGAIQDLLKIQQDVLTNTPESALREQRNAERNAELITALTAALTAAQQEPDNSGMFARLDRIADKLGEPSDMPALEKAMAGLSGQWRTTAETIERLALSAESRTDAMEWPALEEKLDRMVAEIQGLGAPITAAAATLQAATGQLLEGSTSSQTRASEALDRSAEALLAGTDGYLKAGDTLSTLLQEHQSASRGMAASMDGVSRLMTELEEITANVREGAASMANVLGPVSDSVRSFRAASETLAGVLPGIEGAAGSYERSREALDRSAEALIAGTDGYLKAGDTVRELVGELRGVQAGQSAMTEDWRQSVDSVTALIRDLTAVAARAEASTASMAAVMTPAAATAATFQSASETLAGVLPGIEGAAGSFVGAQAALESSTAALLDSTQGYREAGEIVRGLVESLQQVQTDQGSALTLWQSSVESMSALIGDLGGASDAVRGSVGQLSGVLPPMTSAAGAFLEASERLSVVLPGIEGAAGSYDRSREALDTASRTLITSTEGYHLAGETIRGMLTELSGAHAEAITRISAGVDEALLGRMQAAGEQLMTFNRHQQASLSIWQASTDQLSEMMDAMKHTTGSLTQVAGRLEQTTAPTLTASQSFQAAAEALSEAMPSIQDTARSNAEIRGALEEASDAIRRGTEGYLEAGASVQRIVASLESQHATTLAAAATGLKSALSDPMDAAGARLEGALTAQAALLAAWQQALSQFTPAISQLNQSTTGLSSLAGQFRDAAIPASDAAKSFEDAARRLTTLFPQLESSADGYDRVNQALAAAATELTGAGVSYAASGEQMQALLKELQHTLKLQVLGTREFAGAMDKATHFVDTIGPASERVERAAVGLHDAAEKTTEVVRTVQTTVEIQDGAIVQMRDTASTVVDALKHQASHWSSFLGEMSRLESLLKTSVETLGSELPHSIDHTLVHFDAALGEGVARIGSAIERLREAMDDLNERLEGMLADGGRRR
jgi:ABC-type transporter Mla subunit MlaD